MPHCNDWIPLVLLLGLIPLAFWHHKDRKNEEEKKNSDRDETLLRTTPARFYRQDPYFVVDVPLASNVTHISFGNASQRQALATFPPGGIFINQGQPEVITAWAQLVALQTEGRALRIWKQISPSSTLDQNRDWFNALDVYLWNKTVTTRTRLNHAQIRVPPFVSNTTRRQDPSMADLIRYQNIPSDVPETIWDWGPFFNFHTNKTTASNGDVLIEFAPPTSYAGSWELEYMALRGPDDEHMEIVPDVPFTPASGSIPPNGRMVATFPPGLNDEDATFGIAILRKPPASSSSANILVGVAIYQACLISGDPLACSRLLCDRFGLCDGDFQARTR